MQYKVKALSVGGSCNRIFYSGDIVTAEDFEVPATDLVKQGFLVPYEAPEPATGADSSTPGETSDTEAAAEDDGDAPEMTGASGPIEETQADAPAAKGRKPGR